MSNTVDQTLDFPDLPPFPDDVQTAPLLRISLQKLLDGDPEESRNLWDACRDVGFFYLDLRDAYGAAPEAAILLTNGASKTNGHVNGHTNGDAANSGMIDGNAFLNDAESLFATAEEFYQLPVGEKIKYDFKDEGSYFGYKGYGAGLIDKQGTTDRNEFYNVSKDDILGLSAPIRAPAVLTPHRPLLHSYIQTSHAIVTLVLAHLDKHLDLPAGTLQDLHRLAARSGDQVRFVRAPPQPAQDSRAALGAHTDFGSVTLLFNRLGGLQILPPAADGLGGGDAARAGWWQYVRPLRGHCVVNLGDAMVKFTRGLLRSNTHRVVNPPGAQAASVRHSLVYFSRPSDDVLLRPLAGSDAIDAAGDGTDDGEVITAKDWVLRRALGRRGVGDYDKSEGTETARAQRTVSVN